MLIKKTIRILWYLLSGCQILLGILWMLWNFGRLSQFALTGELMEISHTWILDEYTGIGYPAILFVCSWLQEWIKLPFYVWIYGIQLILAFCSGCYLLSVVFHKERQSFDTIWGSLYLMTIPMIVQCHLAVLPFSLALSCLYILLGSCLQALDCQEMFGCRRAILLGFSMTGLVLLMPDYIWLLLLLGTVAVCVLLFREKRRAVCLLLVFILSLGTGSGANALVQVPGSRGNIQKSISSMILSRVVWPYFDMDYYFWPVEIKEVMTQEMAWTVSCNAERVKDYFGPLVEERYGRRQASQLYLQMAKACFEVRTKDIVKQAAADLAVNACPQLSAGLQLRGVGTGLNAYNYNQMKEANSVLAKYYVNYSLNSFGVLLLLSGIGLIFNKVKKEKSGIWRPALWIMGIAALWQVFYGTLAGAGMMDWKNVLFVAAFYGICILYLPAGSRKIGG